MECALRYFSLKATLGPHHATNMQGRLESLINRRIWQACAELGPALKPASSGISSSL